MSSNKQANKKRKFEEISNTERGSSGGRNKSKEANSREISRSERSKNAASASNKISVAEAA